MKLSLLSTILFVGVFTLNGCSPEDDSNPSDDNPTENHAPIANAQSITVEKDTDKTITLSGSDTDGDSLSYTVVANPVNGTLQGTAPNFTYTPNSGYLGRDSFTFKVNDGTVNSALKTISIEIITAVAKVKISGTILYDKVPANSNGVGLDHASTTQEGIKWVVVEAVDSNGNIVDSTTTDSSGGYVLSAVPALMDVKLRISAKMIQSGAPNWDVKVVDNTNSSSLYVMEGALSTSGNSDSRRSLRAPSGWTGRSYGSSRVAAPFAMLDDIYHSMQMVLSAESNVSFPPLIVNWSTLNKPADGSITSGEIGTSYYSAGNLYILGDENSDTDEYDDHVIAHEWGHYYEDKFSRSDSLGGQHGDGERLDIRVAFGEGFGNAVSGMALKDPVYYDTLGQAQSSGWSMDLESGAKDNPGWYSEGSIQRILYDIYDSDDDGSDSLSFGFAPLHTLFTGAQKDTEAFTSLFSFITELKNSNASDAGDIDAIVSSERIDTITDIYGNGRSDTPYNDLTIGSQVNICISSSDGSYNKLSNRRYIKFTIANSDSYTVKVEQTNGSNADPDFYLYKTSPFEHITYSETEKSGIEEKSVSLNTGNYLLDISEYHNLSSACFDVTVKP